MRPHVRVRLLSVDLVHCLQVLVRPHVTATRGRPRGGERIVRDALGAVGKGNVAKNAE
jgi:hypothetical protein